MHSSSVFCPEVRVRSRTLLSLSPPATTVRPPIPQFFVDFLHRLHWMVNEYSAELDRWDNSMRFYTPQTALYGRKSVATAPKGRRKRTILRESNSTSDVRNGQRVKTDRVRIFTLDKQSQSDGQQQKKRTFSLLKPKENLQEIQRQNVQQNVSPNSELQRPSSRRWAAVHPPLSIRDRLRRTFAPENLAIAVNEQMPLETLEQTVTETLPESITQSENYGDFLRQYLEDFQRELENDGLISGPIAERTDNCQIGNAFDRNEQQQCVDGTDSIAAATAGADCLVSTSPFERKFSARREEGAVQPLSSAILSTNAVERAGRRKRTKQSLSYAQMTPSSDDSPVKVLKMRHDSVGTSMPSTSGDQWQTDDEWGEGGDLMQFCQSLAHRTPTEQCGGAAGDDGDRTPQKWVSCAHSSFASSLAAVRPPSPRSVSTVKVLGHGRVEFKGMSPSGAQKTPTKGNNNAPSPADEALLIVTPKLLSTRRVYCSNSSSARRRRRIAPQKEGGTAGENGQRTKGEGELQRKGEEEEEEGRMAGQEKWWPEEHSEDEAGEGEFPIGDGGKAKGTKEGGQRTNDGERAKGEGHSSTNVPRGVMDQSATENGDDYRRVNDPTDDDGKIAFSELDDELIGDVLNAIHWTSPADQ